VGNNQQRERTEQPMQKEPHSFVLQ
jgi:hypothetical protein